MKKFTAIFLVTIMAISFWGCSKNEKSKADTESTSAVTLEEKSTQAQVEMTEYTINGFTYSLPKDCTVVSEEDNMNSYKLNSGDKNMILVRSEVIPDIMRVKVGVDGSVEGDISKDDVADMYGEEDDDYADVTSKEWKKTDSFEYCDIYYNSTAKLADGGKDTRKGRCIVIPVNENEEYFSLNILSDNEEDLKLIEQIVTTIKSK